VFETWGWGQGESGVEGVGGTGRAVLWGQSGEVDVLMVGSVRCVWWAGIGGKKGKPRQSMSKVVKRALPLVVGAGHPV
jgi:hypothetical protein